MNTTEPKYNYDENNTLYEGHLRMPVLTLVTYDRIIRLAIRTHMQEQIGACVLTIPTQYIDDLKEMYSETHFHTLPGKYVENGRYIEASPGFTTLYVYPRPQPRAKR